MNAHFEQGKYSIAGFESYLTDLKTVSASDLVRAKDACAQSNIGLLSALVDLGLVAEDDLVASLASYTGLSIASADAVDSNIARQLGWSFLKNAKALPLVPPEGQARVFVVFDPFDEFLIKSLKMALGAPVSLQLAAQTSILRALEDAEQAEEPVKPHITAETGFSEGDIALLKEKASEAPVIQLGIQLFERAIELRATDIHLDATATGLDIRLRVDGVLQAERRVDKAMAAPLVSRLKLLAGVDIAESRLPQDGRIRTTVRGRSIDMRLATLPSHHGESVVVRLLDQSRVTLSLPALGFDEAAQATLRKLTDLPNGIILVTGPTGSGKTTTLYSLLELIRGGNRKIITVEDPIEYEKEGLTQVQVRPQIDLTFARVLRAALRHDPDVLLVGEIRDAETARVAVEASLTGHLVLATLHTNTAAGAPARLIDMGVEDYLLASTLAAVIGQRLVRKLCAQCSVPAEGDVAVLKTHGSKGEAPKPKQAVGCAECNQSGYQGRTVAYEIMETTSLVRDAILSRTDAATLQARLVENGFVTMRRCGLEKAARGEVALGDVLLATGDAE